MNKDMKGGKADMHTEKIMVEKTLYLELCPYCKQKIKSNSEAQLKYNIRIHMDKHQRNGDDLVSKNPIK